MLGCVFENILENIFKFLVAIMNTRERERRRRRRREGGVVGFKMRGKRKDLKRSVENERVVGWCWVDCGVENVVPNSLEFVKV